jgi:hypothetical protein
MPIGDLKMQLNISIKQLEDGSYLINYNHGFISKTHKASAKTRTELANFMKSLIKKEVKEA